MRSQYVDREAQPKPPPQTFWFLVPVDAFLAGKRFVSSEKTYGLEFHQHAGRFKPLDFTAVVGPSPFQIDQKARSIVGAWALILLVERRPLIGKPACGRL